MTLVEAKKLALEGHYITRPSWITETTTKLITKQGGYSKPVGELYGGVLKIVAEYFKADGVTIEPHLDALIIDDESPNVTCICGYQFSQEDIWADDYTTVRLEQGLDLNDLPKEEAEAIGAKLDELVLKGEAIVVDTDKVTVETPVGQVTVPVETLEPIVTKAPTGRRTTVPTKTTSNEEQPKDVQ